MPPEPKQKLKRKASRRDADDFRFDGTHARELELKRNRGEVSCAECRRLKIKCSKEIPCQSCVRRGCGTLCPNGSLSTGQGTRFVLAATEHLHRRIAKLSDRVRQLEDALASLHAKSSDEPHPLLREELLSGNNEDQVDSMAEDNHDSQPHHPEVIDAFGTLSISDHGISRFFGPTGGSESLLLSNVATSHTSPDSSHSPDSSNCDNTTPSNSNNELYLFSRSFPFTPMGQLEEVQDMIRDKLPIYERARALCETYFEQVAWIFHGVTRQQLIDEMLPVIYRQQAPEPGEDFGGPHDLSLLFMIFAIGALVEKEGSLAEAEHFHQIGRAAISLQPVLEKPSIVTIQTLHLMSIYNAMSGSDLTSETSMEMTWSLITMAAHLSQTIGLHRDSERWGLPPKMVQRRRILFWDLFVADVWQSLNTGRPPSFSLAYIDCAFPHYPGSKPKDGGLSFEVWQFRFAAECVAEVTARTLTAEAPTYATIMELDRKVREFPLPESTADKKDLGASFQRCVLEHIKETVLMYIHRSFFAQAIIDQPMNPLKSVYAPSFLAAYRASTTILKSVKEQFSMWPIACARFWTMWTFAFSAAVVLGTVVTRGPGSPLATSAMTELEQACVLFSKATVYSKRAAKAMPILTKLSEKARYALAAAQSDPSPSGDSAGLSWNVKAEDNDDELNILAGHTRFVSAKRHPPHASSNTVAGSQRMPFEPVAAYNHPAAQPPPQQQHPIPGYGPEGSQARLPPMMTNWTPDHRPPRPEEYSAVLPLSPVSLLDERVQYSYSYDRAGGPPRGDGNHSAPPSAPNYQWSEAHQQFTGPGRMGGSGGEGAPYYPRPPHQSIHLPPPPPTAAPSFSAAHNPLYQIPSPSHPHVHSDLADLGLASRDSRLDERWSSFMQESGLLDEMQFRGH